MSEPSSTYGQFPESGQQTSSGHQLMPNQPAITTEVNADFHHSRQTQGPSNGLQEYQPHQIPLNQVRYPGTGGPLEPLLPHPSTRTTISRKTTWILATIAVILILGSTILALLVA